MLESLLPEICDEIFEYCRVDDLKNLACTSSQYNHALKPVLYHTIKVPLCEKHVVFHPREEDLQYVKTLLLFYVARDYQVESKDSHNDETFSELCEGVVNLKGLEIQSTGKYPGHQITDVGLKSIEKLLLLEELTLHKCTGVTHQGVASISTLPILRKLNLTSCRNVNDEACSFICKLTTLEELSLEECNNISDKGLVHIGTISTLIKLSLKNCEYDGNITAEGFASLTNLPLLKELNIYKCGLSDDMLTMVSAMCTLEDLIVGSDFGNITEDGLLSISKVSALRKLALKGYCDIPEQGISYITSLPELKELDLFNSGLFNSNSGLSLLSNLHKLEKLDLAECRGFTDEGLLSISNISTLRKLNLHAIVEITDGGVSYLTKLPLLQELNLSNCFITDQALAHISTIRTLEKLNVNYCSKITDAGLLSISTMGALRELFLTFYGNGLVTIEGVINHLHHIPVVVDSEGDNLKGYTIELWSDYGL